MNRIYQVVWSKAKNCYTVVSEIAKRHGKGNRARTCAAAFLAALALTSVMGMSEAQAETIEADAISNGDARIALNGAAGMVGMVNGKGESIFMYGGHTTINNIVAIDQTGKISGVAAGAVTADSTDAVNGSQLHAVAAEAGKHSKVVHGSNINVEESEVNGQKIYKVGLNDDVHLGTIETTGSITTKDSISAANGAQLADIKVSGNVISNGKAAIALYGDSGIAGMMNGKGASIYMQDGQTSINKKVNIDKEGNITGANAINTNAINTKAVNANVANVNTLNAQNNLTVGGVAGNGLNPFFVDSNGAFHAAAKKFSVDKDGKVTATAGEIGNVVLQNGKVTATEGEIGGVTINKGMISNGDAKIALYGDSGIAGMMNGKGASIYMQDGQTSINKKVNIDKEGNITGANAINTNAINTKAVNANVANVNTLNAQNNLTVGGVAGNGLNPFFVDSNGAFHAAAKKFSVDKDGKVTATEGEIGGVTINKGMISNGDAKIALYGDSGIAGMMNGKGASIYMQDGNTVINRKVNIDKDGKVTATAGEIGNVVLQNGKVTAAAGEIGGVTIKEGNITGVNAINTSAINTNVLNSKYNLSVGTANENGTMPFFVNSNGAFYAANGKLVVDKDGKVTATAGKIGNVVLNNGVFTGNSKLRDGELFVGDASGNYSQITTKGAKLGKVTVAEDGKITGVAAGKADTDAVNVGQLKTAVADAVKDAAKASDVGNIGDIHKELQNKDGSKTTVVDAVNNLDNKVGDLKYSAVTKGDIKDGDSSTTAIGKLNQKLSGVAAVAGQHSSVSTTDANIKIQEGTNAAGGKDYQLSLNPDQKLHSVTTGETKMDTNGISINGKTYVSKDGLNANGNKVTQVADGKLEKDSKDAVNGGQLYATNQLVKDNASNISLLGNSINKLDNRVDKVGAGAAALAALHPLDFDPEDKWDFAAGYGNYSGASAVALGAYYRPNEDTMFSVGGSFGNGENMVNAGVSLKLGQSNRAPASKAAMEKKISALSQEVEELKAAIADLRAAQTKAKDATAKDAQKK